MYSLKQYVKKDVNKYIKYSYYLTLFIKVNF